MSATPEPSPATRSGSVCPLCGAEVAPVALRCDECGMTLAGVGERPGPFRRRSLWVWAGALLVIYLVVLALVASVHD